MVLSACMWPFSSGKYTLLLYVEPQRTRHWLPGTRYQLPGSGRVEHNLSVETRLFAPSKNLKVTNRDPPAATPCCWSCDTCGCSRAHTPVRACHPSPLGCPRVPQPVFGPAEGRRGENEQELDERRRLVSLLVVLVSLVIVVGGRRRPGSAVVQGGAGRRGRHVPHLHLPRGCQHGVRGSAHDTVQRVRGQPSSWPAALIRKTRLRDVLVTKNKHWIFFFFLLPMQLWRGGDQARAVQRLVHWPAAAKENPSASLHPGFAGPLFQGQSSAWASLTHRNTAAGHGRTQLVVHGWKVSGSSSCFFFFVMMLKSVRKCHKRLSGKTRGRIFFWIFSILHAWRWNKSDIAPIFSTHHSTHSVIVSQHRYRVQSSKPESLAWSNKNKDE